MDVAVAVRRFLCVLWGLGILVGCGAIAPCTADRCIGDFSALEGPFLGQRPPGLEPELFAPGFISTGLDELNSVFHPNGQEFYFAVDVGPRFVLMVSRKVDPGWTEPEVVSFSRRHSAVDLAFSADGERMFFCSNRPRAGGIHPERDYDIWWTERQGDGWGEPRHLAGGVNTDTSEFYPSLTDDGTLYFLSRREGGLGGGDIYRSRWVDGVYGEAENLGPVINTGQGEGDAFIARDESFLVFVSSGHDRGPDEGRLFVSFRSDDDQWSQPRNLGPLTDPSDYCPVLSPDGEYFFFTGTRTRFDTPASEPSYETLLAGLAKPQNGNDDIYWVDVEFIERLRPGSSAPAVM